MRIGLKMKTLLAFALLLFAINAGAQDYKFSQFYNSPLNLNPASTGKINSLYRFVANYRIQYLPIQSSPTPYNTLSGSADFGLFRDKLKGDIFGLGIIFTNDRQSYIRTNTAMLSIGFNKGLGRDKKHFLSFGTQVGFTQRVLDISNLSFEKQFTGTGFDLQLPSGENLIDALRAQNQTRAKFMKANVNLGLLWSGAFNKMWSAYAGFSMFNIVKPKDTFLKSDNERAFRFNAHAGVLIDIKKIVLISPNGMYMQQAKAQQWIAGTSVSVNLSGKSQPYKTALSAGFWYDGNKAIIASTGVSFSGVQIAISYDATLQKDLSKATKSFGAIEASIIYTGRPLDKRKQYSPLLCPHF